MPEITFVWNVIWNDLLINPMINSTVFLARVLLNNYGLAIIVFTLLMRLLTLPLTIRQVHSQRKMTQLQPQLNEISKKYNKDPKKKTEETMKLYKEAGASPAGCLGPMLIQFPIWIALYDVIRDVLGSTPESLIDLSHRLYPWSFIQQAIPIGNHFLLWDMGKADQSFVLPVLVGASMWVQQKLTMNQASMTPANQTQAQTNQTLLWMMPLMFGYITINVPSGLAIYWLISNITSIIINYYVFGWKGTSWLEILFRPSAPAAPKGSRAGAGNSARPTGSDRGQLAAGAAPELKAGTERRGANGKNGRSGSKRKDDRRGSRPGAQPTRSGPQSGGGRGP